MQEHIQYTEYGYDFTELRILLVLGGNDQWIIEQNFCTGVYLILHKNYAKKLSPFSILFIPKPNPIGPNTSHCEGSGCPFFPTRDV